MKKECLVCANQVDEVPNLRCGHFICPPCYVKLKNLSPSQKECHCPYCFKKLVRR